MSSSRCKVLNVDRRYKPTYPMSGLPQFLLQLLDSLLVLLREMYHVPEGHFICVLEMGTSEGLLR
jgi:hypothetical protein